MYRCLWSIFAKNHKSMRKTILLSAMSLGLVCFVLSSCSEGTTEEKRMSLAVEEISFPKEGGSERIAILAEGVDSLNAYATESWIDVEVDNGNSSVVVSAAPTDEISGLSGKVFVYADIEQMRKILEDDDRLINIRTSIREASESQLRNGTLLISDLLRDINDEHRARIDKSIHELEYLKKLYEMRYTLNY